MKRTWGTQLVRGLVGREWLTSEAEAVVRGDSERNRRAGMPNGRDFEKERNRFAIKRAFVILS